MVGTTTNYNSILQMVMQWSPQERFALIRALLDSLEPVAVKTTVPSTLSNLAQNGSLAYYETIDENTWLRAVARNPAFADLSDPSEDIYSLTDGEPN